MKQESPAFRYGECQELRNGKSGVKRFGHILVMNAFNPSDGEFEVNHINLNKADNRLVNLEWVTHAENMKHARDSGVLYGRRTRTKSILVEPDCIVFNGASGVANYLGVKVTTIYSGCQMRHKVKGRTVRYIE